MIGAAAAGAIFGDNIGFWVGRIFGQRLVRGRAAGADLCGLHNRSLAPMVGRSILVEERRPAMINAPAPHKRSEALARPRGTNAGAGTDNDKLRNDHPDEILRPITTNLPTERRSRPMGKSHQQMPSHARRAATYHDPRSDELTLSSIFRNKVAVPTLAFHEGRQTQLRHDMVDDRPPSGCEPESDCAAGWPSHWP